MLKLRQGPWTIISNFENWETNKSLTAISEIKQATYGTVSHF